MKRILMIMGLCVPAIAANAQGIGFHPVRNWDQLKKMARKENKLIFFDIYASWCGPCKKMDKEVYADSSVGQYMNERFISIKLQADSNTNDIQLLNSDYAFASEVTKQFGLDGFPCYYFVDAEGRLLYRSEGFQLPREFLKTAAFAQDATTNLVGRMQKANNAQMDKKGLLQLALDLKKAKQQDAALKVIKQYKKRFLDGQPPFEILDKDILPVFGEFSEIFHAKDQLITYIFLNKSLSDSLMDRKGFSTTLIDFFVNRDYMVPAFFRNGKASGDIASITDLEKRIAAEFDAKTARKAATQAKCSWYELKKDYPRFLEAWFEKVDSFGIDMKDPYGALEINNTIYEIVLTQTNDPVYLKKSIAYMEALLKVDPDSYSRLDTYASILYKNGQKQKAIEVEKKALALAAKMKDDENVKFLNETILKMEKGEPIW
ncbi:MAG: DUF255 domain-containing protein [Chitinophagaceae bacterium]|nr:DUF255 domain-containing protein [Chitinophagaceae bacterium]